MQHLKDLARFAADNRIHGRARKPNPPARNSILKPFDFILQELEKCPKPGDLEELRLVQAGTKDMIFEHLRRVADDAYKPKPGGKKETTVYEYVDKFFAGFLFLEQDAEQVKTEDFEKRVNKVLGRERLIRSAYLFYFRERLVELKIAREQAKKTALESNA